MDALPVNDCEILEVETESRVPLHVTFHDAENNCYLVGEDVRCSYKILASLELNSYDWVGLFKVGSTLPSEYLYYEWSPLPKDYVKGTDVENAVVFPGRRMPSDDGKLYQFSYISADRKMCGTSKPFGFRLRMSDEKGEKEHMEDGELVVSQTKTSTLEAKIREETEDNVTLKEKRDHMNDAASGLLENQNQLEVELSQEKEQIEQLKSMLQEKTATAESRELKNQTLELCIVQLEEKVSGLQKNNSELLETTVVNDANIMEPAEELMQSRMKYSDLSEETQDVRDQLIHTMNMLEEYKCQIAEKENEVKELDLNLAVLDEEKKKMMEELSDNSVYIDIMQSEIQMLTDSRNKLMEKADRVEEENRQFQASTFVSLMVLNDRLREADQVKAELEKRLVEEIATSARTMKLAEKLKEELLRYVPGKEKENKIAQKERAELRKCVAEHATVSLNANKLAAELKEQLQNQLLERKQEKKAAETVKADLEKRLTVEITSSQSSKKLADELKEQLEKLLFEKEREMKAFEKTKAELEKRLSEEIAASGRVKNHLSLLFFELMTLKDENAKLQRQMSQRMTKTEEKQQLSDIPVESQLSNTEQEKKVVEQKNEYLSKFCSEEHVTRVDVSQSLKDCEERLQKNLLSEKEGETTEAAKDKNSELENGEMAKSADMTKTVQELFLEKEQELTAAEKEMAKHLSAEVDSSVHWESLAQQRPNDATLMIERFEKNMTHVESCHASERAHSDLFGTEFSSKMKDLKKSLSERMITADMAEEMAERSERRLLKLKADFEDYFSNKMACSERVKRVLNEERSEREHEQRTTKDLKLELETCLTDAEQTSLAYKQCNQDFSTHVTAYDRDTELKNATQQVLLEKQALIDQREDLKNKIHAEMQNKQLEMVQSCFRKTKEIKRNIEESVVSDFHEEGLRSDRNNLGSSELQQTNDDDLSFDSVDIKMCPVYNTHIFCKPGTTAFLEHLTAHPFHAN